MNAVDENETVMVEAAKAGDTHAYAALVRRSDRRMRALACGAVSFETQDRSGVLVNYGTRFLYVDVSHVEGVEPVDVIELVTTLSGS